MTYPNGSRMTPGFCCLREVTPADQIYILVEQGDFPYVDGPLGRSAMVFAFVHLEDALKYRDELVGEGAITRDQVKIMTMKMKGLWELIDELTVFAQEEYESGFEILLHEPYEVTTSIYNSTLSTHLN